MTSNASKYIPRKTVIDLYNEKEEVRWYIRFLAYLSACLLLLSLLFFPVSFPDGTTGQTISSQTALIITLLFFTISYVLAFALVFLTRSWMFQFEVIYLPHLFASIMGLVNLICGLSIYATAQINGKVIANLVLALLSILCFTFCSLLVFRKIRIVRRRDLRQRSASGSVTHFTMPETELQRQQLLRLLISQDENLAESPNNGAEATYKIQWPSSTAAHTRRNTMSTLRNNMHLNRFSRRGSLHQHHRSHSGNSNMTHSRNAPEVYHEGMERAMPDVIVEEPTNPSYTSHERHLLESQGAPPPANRQHMHNPVLPGFFDVHPGERIPSYHPRNSMAHSQATPQTQYHPTLPAFGPNGYLIDKPEHEKRRSKRRSQQTPRPQHSYTVVDEPNDPRPRTQAWVGQTQQASRPLEEPRNGGPGVTSELQGDYWRHM